jgi:FixJ family two-component response regulator
MNAAGVQKPTVYVLDDEPAMRDSLRELLESADYQVATFGSPKEFLHVSDFSAHACLILDLKMPEISGLEVLVALNRRRLLLPTIVLTAAAEVPTIVSAMKSGAVNLLEKPCGEAPLLAAVREALSRSTPPTDRPLRAEDLSLRMPRLSAREQEVLKELLAGFNVKQIARKLGTSPNTVRNQRRSILEKAGVETVADLFRMILESQQTH